MATDERTIGIVGSGIAGLRAANAILKREVDARIVIFGDEAHRTYSRPGLTKRRYPPSDAPGTTMARDLKVNGSENDALHWRLGTRVAGADLRNKVLKLDAGETFEYDSLVIAAGVRPLTLPGSGTECEVHTHHTLRGLDDAQYIHNALRKGGKLTIAGGGFVACELASLATEYGCDIVMLAAPRRGPFESLLGSRISHALRRWVVQHGVTFVSALRPSSPKPASDRSLFVEAIGSVPNVEWLYGNGLDLSDGVRVDEYMRVTEYQDVFAAGDIARYPGPWTAGSLVRVELWKNAIDTGVLAGRSLASSLLHDSEPSGIGYFPSMVTELFGLRIQIAGDPKASDAMEVVRGDLDRLDRGVLVKFLQEDATVGVAYLDKGTRFNSVYIELVKSLKLSRRVLV